jgi:hypothetical protein
VINDGSVSGADGEATHDWVCVLLANHQARFTFAALENFDNPEAEAVLVPSHDNHLLSPLLILRL